MFGKRLPGARSITILVLGVVLLGACTSDSVETYDQATENYLIGCLEPIEGQPAQFKDGKVIDPESYPNYDECASMWEQIREELPFDDFTLVSGAIDEEPDLLDMDEVPTGLVSEDDQARLEASVEILQEIALTTPSGGTA